MSDLYHAGIYTDNHTDKKILLRALTENRISGLGLVLRADNTVIFSKLTIEQMIDEEIRHDRFVIPPHEGTTLQYMSSGQQRKALLNYQLSLNPECLILDDVYANIDVETQQYITRELQALSQKIQMIQIFSRKRDLLPFVERVVLPDATSAGIKATLSRSEFLNADVFISEKRTFSLPMGYESHSALPDNLIELKNESVD
jgi:molybdate transport system ATP-binding protein